MSVSDCHYNRQYTMLSCVHALCLYRIIQAYFNRTIRHHHLTTMSASQSYTKDTQNPNEETYRIVPA